LALGAKTLDPGVRRDDEQERNVRTVLTLNGLPAQADDLRLLVANNYGHFTAMRVERGAVRGLDLHLDRLTSATRELFASELDRVRVREWLREAVAGETQPLSVRINVFSRQFDRAHPAAPATPDVLISVLETPPSHPPAPLRLKSFRYGRELPHVKHVGTFPLFHFRALAQRAGFDDALFVGEDGRIAEASIWNIGFHDGERIVWPQAPQLDGISQQLLQAGCERLGVGQVTLAVQLDEILALRAAFLTNAASVAQPVTRIDGHDFAVDRALLDTLQRCYESNPLDLI
jgi:branched-subunit amino acid aminotransferase/4-amino-4-deoxychorismate lyase